MTSSNRRPGPARDHRRAPLLRLWAYAAGHRPRLVAATVLSVLNTIADVAPPFLIGVAVDVVTRGDGSVVAAWTGVTDLRTQLYVVAAATVVVWVFESLTDYAADVLWRNLAQTIEHEAGSRPTSTSRASTSPPSRTAPPAGCCRC